MCERRSTRNCSNKSAKCLTCRKSNNFHPRQGKKVKTFPKTVSSLIPDDIHKC